MPKLSPTFQASAAGAEVKVVRISARTHIGPMIAPAAQMMSPYPAECS
jgi:hypothetical protein